MSHNFNFRIVKATNLLQKKLRMMNYFSFFIPLFVSLRLDFQLIDMKAKLNLYILVLVNYLHSPSGIGLTLS